MATRVGRAVLALTTTTIGLLPLVGRVHEAGAVTPADITYEVLRDRDYDRIGLSGDLRTVLLTDVVGRGWGNRITRLASGTSYVLPPDEQGLVLDRTGAHVLVEVAGGLRVRTVATGAERTVDTTRPPNDSLVTDRDLVLAADGSSVVFPTFDPNVLRSKLWYAAGTSAPVDLAAGLPATHFNAGASDPAISADGRYVVFVWANYVLGCTTPGPDCLVAVIRYDTRTGDRTVVSLTPAGTETAGVDYAPAVSGDGQLVVWFTTALDVAPGLSTPLTRLVARDLVTGTTTVLATGDDTTRSTAAVVSDDGRRVAATLTGPVNVSGAVFPGATARLIDRADGTVTTLGPLGRLPDAQADVMGMSPDGTRIAYHDSGLGVLPPPGINGPFVGLATVPRTDLPASSVPVVPERLLDTRTGLGRDGDTTKPGAGTTVELQVTGAGATAVPADATAVVLNVTATEAGAAGYVTVWPCGTPRPTASNLNVSAGQTVPNLVAVKLGTDGKVCLYTQSGTHLLADIAAWYPTGATFTPIVPERLLDTRTGLGHTAGKPAAGTTVELTVVGTGATAVPADASAVLLNVTGTEATADGYVTVWPCGTPRPTASNLNLVRDATRPNLVAVKLGTDGKVCLYTQSGTHLLADIAAWYPTGATFTPIVPERLLDTRTGLGHTAGKPAAGTTVELTVVDVGATQMPSGTRTVLLNVTATDATADGYVTVWPCGTPRPTASNLNLTTGETAPNLVTVGLGENGTVCLYTQSGTHLLADVAGYEA